jgi:hypothetical protein
MKMDKAVQIRMPQAWHDHLQAIAKMRGPGTKVTALIREAVYQVYPLPSPITDIGALRGVETKKKARSS